ncbi:alkaline phosphatase D family protein [Massilia pinisoli]|uniref:Alkaline phosphatase D family protein n=1 Tax=Massilia pinisoli TaxID=1772194 RepID=A0ABT1ZTV9_9BURK|nr:alkaline phosphatase D family protein [Massilia pinisoli]MCS0583355.1 alkaline phosphatase D family protein [Massilia pinisoli]
MTWPRRLFLLNAARLAAASTAASPSLLLARPSNGAGYPFSLGVASGSPLPDAVVLWTRVAYDPLDATKTPPLALTLRWEAAHDGAFRNIVAQGSAVATPALAHSVRVDVRGLQPARWYWYRFMLGDAVSPVGRTRTAPAPDSMPESLKLAVASCQHWEFGSYAAHRYIEQANPDLVAFLGDYIYEWGAYRLHHPAPGVRIVRQDESFLLADYRRRYAQYKTDPDLQSAHLAAPWIVTWDDHEVANDYAADRDERLAPDFWQRRAAAYQAFYEHMPLRLPPPASFANVRMFQRYDWGRLARFHVLDDRQYRAYEACPHPGHGGSNSVTPRACPDLLDPRRTMLGLEQEAWLKAGLGSSRARWNILAQQTLMAQSSQIPVTPTEAGRFWTDGWDGYPAARRRLLDTLVDTRAANPLVLGGDVHTFYATELRRDFDRPVSTSNPVVATEFVGTSITSNSRPQQRTSQYVAMNPHIKYGRSDKRGYMLMEITPRETRTRFLGLDEVRDPKTAQRELAAFRVADGKPGVEITAV